MQQQEQITRQENAKTYRNRKKLINNNNITEAVKKTGNVPLLYVDDSEDSAKAKTDLDQAKRFYVVQKVHSDSERKNLDPPILFAPEGTFKGYFEINSFAFSIFWTGKKS